MYPRCSSPASPLHLPCISKVVPKSLDPRWDERLLFPGTLADFIEETLTIKLRDKDTASFDDPLGEVQVRPYISPYLRGQVQVRRARSAISPYIPPISPLCLHHTSPYLRGQVRLGALDGLKRGSSRIDFAHQALQPELPAGGRRGSLSGKP